MTDQAITIDRTGPDWEPGIADGFYAQRGIQGEFAFGATETEALANLLKREEAKAKLAEAFRIG